MNTNELINDISTRMLVTKEDARELLLDHFRASLLDALARGETVKITGIGTFCVSLCISSKQIKVEFMASNDFLADLNRKLDAKALEQAKILHQSIATKIKSPV